MHEIYSIDYTQLNRNRTEVVWYCSNTSSKQNRTENGNGTEWSANGHTVLTSATLTKRELFFDKYTYYTQGFLQSHDIRGGGAWQKVGGAVAEGGRRGVAV